VDEINAMMRKFVSTHNATRVVEHNLKNFAVRAGFADMFSETIGEHFDSSVLQCAAVCCGALQCGAVRCSVAQCVRSLLMFFRDNCSAR